MRDFVRQYRILRRGPRVLRRRPRVGALDALHVGAIHVLRVGKMHRCRQDLPGTSVETCQTSASRQCRVIGGSFQERMVAEVLPADIVARWRWRSRTGRRRYRMFRRRLDAGGIRNAGEIRHISHVGVG